MHCTHCGKELLPDTRFCPECGTAVSRNESADTAAADSTSGWQSPPPRSGSYTVHVRPELLRPRSGRMIAGVCAAFARTYGWNVVLIRILLVVLTPLHLGLGFLAYVVAWIIIPEEPYRLPAVRP